MRGLVALCLALTSLVAVAVADDPTCATVSPPSLSFDDPVYIDSSRAGGEPVSVVAHDGSILVSAHAGTTHLYKDPEAVAGMGDFAGGYFNQVLNWRSTDGGQTWRYIGTAGLPAGPHTATSTGFSDPDLTIDSGGTIYNTEIDLANVSVFASLDDGQSFPIGTPIAASGDRPWLTGQEPGEVFLYVNTERQLWHSTTYGVAFELVDTGIPATGKMVVDPLHPEDGLIGPIGLDGVAISPDDGRTWQRHFGSNLGDSTQFFGTVAADRAGTVYTVAAGGYHGSNDSNLTNGQVTFNWFDRATNDWGSVVTIPAPPGDALWPWITAGDDGRVAVVWYQRLAGSPDEFYIYIAYTHNGHGTMVPCSDGTSRFVPPQFRVVNASGRPIHVGTICLQGTACNLSLNLTATDRRLGDFFTVNFDLEGNVFIASGDTLLRNPLGGPKPVSNPIFIRQSGGDPILATPITPRPTRCLFPLPVC